MKIERAIEILDRKIKQDVFQVDPDALVALCLGNEALKRLEQERSEGYVDADDFLPGETE